MNRITVLPGGPDRRVPVENLRNVYFDPEVPREVYDTPYIRRRLRDGDLVEVDPKTGTPVPPAAAEPPTGKSPAQVALEGALANSDARKAAGTQTEPAAHDEPAEGAH